MTSRNSHLILVTLMLLGAILGGLLGYVAPAFMLSIAVIGQLFLGVLKLIFIPLIVSVVIVGIASIGNLRRLGRVSRSTILYFLGSSVAAVVVGIGLVYIINPGQISGQTTGLIYERTSEALNTGFPEIFSAFAPTNIFQSIVNGNYLGVVVLAFLFGVILATMGKRAAVVMNFFKVISEASLKLVSVVLYAVPVGLFVLVGSAIAADSGSITQLWGNLSLLGLTLLGGILIHGLIVLPLILKLTGGKSAGRLAGNLSSALVTALGTGSSVATFPLTYEGVVEKHKVDNRAGALVLPLGTMVNLNGTSMYLAITAIFVAQLFGVSLSVGDIIVVGLLSVVLSFGASGIAVPITGPFMLAMLMGAVNYPVVAFGVLTVLLAFDWIFQRGRAILNVWGNAVGAVVVGESFEFKTARNTYSASKEKSQASSKFPHGKQKKYHGDKTGRDDRHKNKSKSRKKQTVKSNKRTYAKSDSQSNGRAPHKERRSPSRSKHSTYHKRRKEDHSVDKSTNSKPVKSSRQQPSSPPVPPKLPDMSKQLGNDKNRSDGNSVNNKKDGTAPVESSPYKNEQARITLSSETIERERSKIAAQLADMKQKEKQDQQSNKVDKTKSDVISVANESEEKESPVIDFYSAYKSRKPLSEEDNSNLSEVSGQSISVKTKEPKTTYTSELESRTTETTTQLENNKPNERKQDSDNEMTFESEMASKEPVADFGRKPTRRGPARKQTSSDNKSEPAKPVSKYDTDDISFGRQKRKRTR
ncbi:MAG: cation:dicarboxylase symporter family transporter [candidate division Zixibacteria bacterium]|nr:cation:dicarboxylase symporter family transporter [candidate division Zixibacteria bacterium]